MRPRLQQTELRPRKFKYANQKNLLSILAAVFLLVAAACETQTTASTPLYETSGAKDHYLLLVNTAMARQMDAQKLTQFDRSPYDGLAVSFSAAYDVSPVPTPALIESQLAAWKNYTSKQIWPWVYLNRMIGARSTEGDALSRVPYFQKFQGLDLDGKAGAQDDFLRSWRNGLRAARDAGVPGIVLDLEFYNNYTADDISELARMTSMSKDETLRALRTLGARMADIASTEYSTAVIWILFTGFTRPDYRIIDGQPYFLAGTYIAEGLLDRIRQQKLSLHVLAGGEVSLGYCHTSIEDLRQSIDKRAAIFDPILQKYRGSLEMAGTVTLWSDTAEKKNWVAQGACKDASAATVEDLIPYMETLFRTYRYNWIYGSPNGGYLAFNPAVAPRFDAAIAKAKQQAYGQVGVAPVIHPTATR